MLREAISIRGGTLEGEPQLIAGGENVAAVEAYKQELSGEAPPTRVTRRELRTGAIPPVRQGSRPIHSLLITGLTAAEVGRIAMVNGVELHELTTLTSTLEDAYLELTQHAVEYHGTNDSGIAAKASRPAVNIFDAPDLVPARVIPAKSKVAP
jgi:glucose-6-phosphate isomerase